MNIENNNLESCHEPESLHLEASEEIGDWYLAKATPFHEKSAIEWLKKMAKDESCEDDIIEYFIPQVAKKLESNNSFSVGISDSQEESHGKKQETLKSFMIGYFAVKINLSPNLQKILYKIQRSISSKYKIIIFQDRKMTKKELEQMKNSSKLVKANEFSLYQPGDEVIITHDSFQNMIGNVASICEKTGKTSIILHILGRNVNVEVDVNKLKKKK
jgi:transcription antitermination factor NusG